MDLLKLMYKRRSVRDFEATEITDEDLNKLLQAALLAPTSRNKHPCYFIVVSNKELLRKLSQCKNAGAEPLAECNKAIVVIANETVSDTWIEDSSIALTYLHLMATELDLGSCWIQIHFRDKDGKDSEKLVCETLEIDDSHRVVGIMAIGIPKSIPEPRTLEDLDQNKVHFYN